MSASLAERLVEIEVRLAFFEDTMTSLNDLIAAHDRQLHELRGAMERLRGELLSVRGALEHDAHDEPAPPHY